ncbi:MAG: FHA domain-containing protein, partial [Phycisphaerae bacterium]|nr:FHA domain-containing protein [Phycisphaerae bacterium]
MEFLILTSGPHRGQILELPQHSERPIRIGRDDADICLGDDHVSRMHAELHVCPGGWRVSDLGSSNGTFVNDVPVDRAHRLEDGDRLDVGHTALVFGCLSDERLAELEDFDPSGVDNAADRLLMAQIIRQTYLQTESEPTEGSAPVLDSAGDCLPLVVAGPVSPEPANSGAGIAGVLVVAAMLIGL